MMFPFSQSSLSVPTQVFVKYYMKGCVPYKLKSEIEKCVIKFAFAWMWIYVYGSNHWKYSLVSYSRSKILFYLFMNEVIYWRIRNSVTDWLTLSL